MAGPGKGKTWTLKRIVQHHRQGGVLSDPIDEFGEIAGARWDVVHYKRLEDASEGEIKDFLDRLYKLEPGACAIFNEGHRWFPNSIPYSANPFLKWADNARNQGVGIAIESKRPALLSAMIADLVQAIAFKPFKFKRSNLWLEGAGVPVGLPKIPRDRWYLMPESDEEIYNVPAAQLALNYGGEFPLTGFPSVLS